MPDPASEARDPAKDKFYTQYGKAMAAWADLEGVLCDWFRRILEPKGNGQVNAEAIFYSARSFNGRADMLKAATGARSLTDDQRTFIRKAIKRVSDYNQFRAKLAHRVTIQRSGFGPEEDGFALYEGDDTSGRNTENPPIREEHLLNATRNFDALSWIIGAVSVPGGIEPQEALQLIGRFPREPHLHVDSHLIEEVYADRS